LETTVKYKLKVPYRTALEVVVEGDGFPLPMAVIIPNSYVFMQVYDDLSMVIIMIEPEFAKRYELELALHGGDVDPHDKDYVDTAPAMILSGDSVDETSDMVAEVSDFWPEIPAYLQAILDGDEQPQNLMQAVMSGAPESVEDEFDKMFQALFAPEQPRH
jgi:hypothetical protein